MSPVSGLCRCGRSCPRCRPRHASARRRCGRYTPARVIRMAPGCVGTLCAGITHGPGGRSLCGRYACGMAPGMLQLCVSAIIGGASAMLALHKTPHCPTAQAVSQTHAPANCSGRPPCAQTALYQGRARRGLGGLRTAYSYTSAPPDRNQIHTLQAFSQKSNARADHRRTRTSGG